MKISITLALALGGLLAGQAALANTSGKMTAQQERMATCSHQSKGMKGEAHKKFMSECLKGHAAPMAAGKMEHAAAKPAMSARAAQQAKMKSCNAEASGKKLKGAERRSFMATCLKGS